MSIFKGVHTLVIIYDGEITFLKVGSPLIKHLKGMGIYKIIGTDSEVKNIEKNLQELYPNAKITLFLDREIKKPEIVEYKTEYCQYCIFLNYEISEFCEFETFPYDQRKKLILINDNKNHISNCPLFKAMLDV